MDIVPFIKSGLTIYGGFKAITESFRALRAVIKSRSKKFRFSGLDELSDAYFSETIKNGDLVEVDCRLSSFGYVYDPSIALADMGYWGVSAYPPASRLPPIPYGKKPVNCFFVYPRQSSGLELTQYDKISAGHSLACGIPLLCPTGGTSTDYLECVVSLRARIIELSPELMDQVIYPSIASKSKYYSLFYKPDSLIRKGFVLSICNEDGQQEESTEIRLSGDLSGISQEFIVPLFVECHVPKLVFTEENFPKHDSLTLTLLKDHSDLKKVKMSEAVKFIFESLFLQGFFDFKSSNISSMGGLFYQVQCIDKSMFAIFRPPANFGLYANIDIPVQYDEGLARMKKFYSIFTGGLIDNIAVHTGERPVFELDFLSDYHFQYSLDNRGVLVSEEANKAVKGNQHLKSIKNWLKHRG